MDMSAQSLDIVASLAGNKIAVLAPQILVVEDETHLRDLLDEALTENGLRIVTAADGIEGMAVLESHPGIELVLSDVRMPRMNGYEFVEKALGMRPELKVLMMTAYATEMPPTALLRAREIRTLRKPFDLDDVCEVMNGMLSRS